MINDEDSQLVLAARDGDAQSYGLLVRKYQGPLFNLALRMTGNAQDAEDLAQAGFIKIYENLGGYDGRRSFRNWAYTIVLNNVRNNLRRKGLIKFLSLDSFTDPLGQPMQIADGAPNAEDKARGNELMRAVEANLLELPPALREAFVLFHFHNNSAGDIAALTGSSANAVSIRLHRARAFLAKRLDNRLAGHISVNGRQTQ